MFRRVSSHQGKLFVARVVGVEIRTHLVVVRLAEVGMADEVDAHVSAALSPTTRALPLAPMASPIRPAVAGQLASSSIAR